MHSNCVLERRNLLLLIAAVVTLGVELADELSQLSLLAFDVDVVALEVLILLLLQHSMQLLI